MEITEAFNIILRANKFFIENEGDKFTRKNVGDEKFNASLILMAKKNTFSMMITKKDSNENDIIDLLSGMNESLLILKY